VESIAFAEFRSRLSAWFRTERRDLPWRRTTDPYAILVSEVMLQQTRVATVIPYYHRFLDRFPSVSALAAATDSELLTAWAGLGYYRRARNLREAARKIRSEGFPSTVDTLVELPGVGRYTAAAVASIAFGQPCGAVDGNLMRVIARLWNDPADTSSATTRRVFQTRADALLDRSDPGGHNQALMELGATVCLPQRAACDRCPVSDFCRARAAGTQDDLPISSKATRYVNLNLEIAVILCRGQVALRQRDADAGSMAGFYELPRTSDIPGLSRIEGVLGTVKHSIMNQRIQARVVHGTANGEISSEGWLLAPPDELNSIPLSSLSRKALRLADLAGIITFVGEN
jgi:A/G-specific adenine glycosylase